MIDETNVSELNENLTFSSFKINFEESVRRFSAARDISSDEENLVLIHGVERTIGEKEVRRILMSGDFYGFF